MRRVSGWAFWAVLLMLMEAVGFGQVSSKNANESGAPSVQATKDPKDMSRAELRATVKGLDADLFGAYNDCKLEKFGSFFPEHLEFYHDHTGGEAITSFPAECSRGMPCRSVGCINGGTRVCADDRSPGSPYHSGLTPVPFDGSLTSFLCLASSSWSSSSLR